MAAGTGAAELMERAGAAAAREILAAGCPEAVTVLCGPGNNGGDGFVVARHLADAGREVVVASDGPPSSEAAAGMASRWPGRVVSLGEAPGHPGVVDALFGIGLTRTLDPGWQAALDRQRGASFVAALDLPSGVSADDGALLGEPLPARLTIGFGALKPAHRLQPAASLCGRVVVADIGLGRLDSRLADNVAPPLLAPGPDTHKFCRGAVLVVGGPAGQGGAARLAARAALRAGAGLVTLAAGRGAMPENAARLDAIMVRDGAEPATLSALLRDSRWRALVAGPALGQDATARGRLAAVLASGVTAVLDGDAFTLFAGHPAGLRGAAVLTPHEGEFGRLFGALPGSKVERARSAAAVCDSVVVLKGPDTVIAAPDGRASINGHASPWLATAGSGDVLAGIIAGRLAAGEPPFEAACAAVWLHGDAGRRGGPGLIAEDLPELLPAVLASLT